MNMKRTIERRKAIVARLRHSIRNAEMVTEETSQSELKMRYHKLQEVERELSDIQQALEEFNEYALDKHSAENIELEEKLIVVFSHIQGLINKENTNETLVSVSNPSIKSEFKLPSITIPKFNGDYRRWQEFHDFFEAFINNSVGLTDVQKLHHLKSNVTNEAADVIKYLPTTSTNFEIAWKLLRNRYHNTRSIVNAHIHTLINQEKIEVEKASSIRKMLDVTNESLFAIEALEVPTSEWDPVVVHILSNKLDAATHNWWEHHLNASTKIPSLKEFTAFLETRFRILEETIPTSKCTSENSNNVEIDNKQTKHANMGKTNNRSPVCSVCENKHWIYKCPEFTKYSILQREQFIDKNELCYNCLVKGHKVSDCRSKFRCKDCGAKHNTLVHKSDVTNVSTAIGSVENPFALHINSNKQTLLATALVPVIARNGIKYTLKALIDQGSEINLLSEEAAQKLNLLRSPVNIPIIGIGNTPAETVKYSTTITIGSVHDAEFVLTTNALIMKSVARLRPLERMPYQNWSHLTNIKLADPTCTQTSKVDLLLGAATYAEILLSGVIKGQPGTPIAQQTKLGWIISGPTSSDIAPTVMNVHIAVENTLDVHVDNQLKRFWEIEEITPIKHWTEEEVKCEEIFRDTHRRENDGRYTVRLPFNCPPEQLNVLQNSRSPAVMRLLQMEKKFNKQPELKEQYVTFMQDYEKRGHMRRLTDVEINGRFGKHYLSHHGVIKESSTTTKLRVVFDASAKTRHGKCLNDVLFTGPTIQNELVNILIRWRKHRIVFTADVEKMYRQINIHPDDIPYQCIVWRENENEPIRDFALKTVTYGTASAPHQAIRTLHQLAMDEEESFHDATVTIKNDFYVDDVMSGSDTLTEALQKQKDLMTVLHSGGFPLRKWASNRSELIEAVPENYREIKVPLEFDKTTSVKTLGLHWHPQPDLFQFKVMIEPFSAPTTKRRLLSDASKIFDPLGWFAPTVIKAKIIFQALWKEGIKWDETIPEYLEIEWKTFLSELPTLGNIQINRWLGTITSQTKCELHGFCDASETAYAAAVYLRVQSTQSTQVSLIMAKTKVAPVKTLSIPRLELCGAVLLIKTLQKAAEALQIESMKVHAWTDSNIVLAWLRSHPSKWKSFVANRVAEIQSTTKINQWHHICSIDNPADCASRGIMPNELKDHPLWWQGPPWLVKSQSEWPMNNDNSTTHTDMEIKVKTLHTIIVDNEILTRYSTLLRLTKITARCLRFIHNVRNKCNKITGPLEVSELTAALNLWIRTVQNEYFQTEINKLKSNENVSVKSKLISLNPYIDEERIIRAHGRLQNSMLSQAEKNPIILPNHNHLTRLIIDDAHKNTLHGGNKLTLAYLRQKYWIINAKNSIRFQLHKCIKCFRFRTTNTRPIMGNLPSTRVNPARAFQHCGVDYAGPIDFKSASRRNAPLIKGYIAIFICMVTKAIHIEFVSSLTTQGFLAAFRRFTARRGLCTKLYSDNGSNFCGADKEIKKLLNQAKSQQNVELINALTIIGVEWHFIPPSSPHFGGLWEAGVKSVKHHLKRTIMNTSLTFEEMSTVLTQIEACLNSRPLYPLNDDIDDIHVLTPGHFLIGAPLLASPYPDILDININRLSRWQQLQHIQQVFWKKWSQDYLHTLHQRNKWKTDKGEVKIGDLVLIKEDNLPPQQWLLGRIVNTHPGDDNIIRVVTIKTKGTLIKRPVTKICILPIEDKNT